MGSEEEVSKWIAENTYTADRAVDQAIFEGYIPSRQQIDTLIERDSASAFRIIDNYISSGYVPSSEVVDHWMSLGTKFAYCGLRAAFAHGYMPSLEQADYLIGCHTERASLTLMHAIHHGYMPTASQIDQLSKRSTYNNNWCLKAAFEGGVVMDCGPVGSGTPISGTYKAFPNGSGVLEQRLRIVAKCVSFIGKDPVSEIRSRIAGVPEEWANATPEQLKTWRESVNAALDKIAAARPAISGTTR